jgi:hypothetical protein
LCTQTSVSKAAVALGVGGPLISAIGKTVDAVGKITTAVGKAISAFSGFGGASVLGPLAVAAGAVGLLAWITKESENVHIEGYDEWMAKVEELGQTAENVKQKTAELNKSMGEILQGVTIETQPIKDLQTRLHFCFEENGKLKIRISDTGQGFDEKTLRNIRSFLETRVDEGRLGVGIVNTVQRMDILYHGDVELTVGNEESGGACTEICLPLLRKTKIQQDALTDTQNEKPKE